MVNTSKYFQSKIETVKDYINLVGEIKSANERSGNKADLIFRGQNIDKPLLPKLARLNLNGTITKVERLILDEFKRGMLPLTNS